MKIEKALITGASSGIGEALAYLLAQKNIQLILSGRNQKKLEEVAKKTGAEKIIVADLKEKQGRLDVIAAIQLHLPDLVVNNAGYAVYGDVLSSTSEDQENVLQVNAIAPLDISIESARALISAKKKGVILNVSSVAGEYPTPGMGVYGASKSFLTMFSRAFHQETVSNGVDVLVACPGMVSTDFANRAAGKKISLKGPILSASFVAEEIWRQIQKRQQKRIMNYYYRLGTWIGKYLVPETFIMKLISKRIRERL